MLHFLVCPMRTDKHIALKLRLRGRSYSEISTILKVPKSTLSNWFSNIQLSDTATERIKRKSHESSWKGLLKRNKNQTKLAIERMHTAHADGKNKIGNISLRELQLIGLALYWAEGYKRPKKRDGKDITNHPISLTNSDPKLITVFLRFLREVYGISDEKIHVDIRIYEHMNEDELLQFWKKITNLPEKNFGKFYYGISKSSQGKKPFNRLPYGTLQVRVNNTNLFHQIMGGIEGLF